MRSTVVAILYPGCIFYEIALTLEILASKFEIVFATPDGEEHQASNGSVIKNCVTYSKVDLSRCKAVLVPGGDPKSIKDNEEIDEVLRNANKRGLLLAAICAGPSVLAKAGVLKGRRIAHGYGPKEIEFLKSYFEGATLTDEKFILDGNVMTAKPDAHIDFAVEIACRLDCADASKANRLKDYYRGLSGRKIRPLSLAVIQNSQGKFLFDKGYDRVTNETFYRPPGGGIEFSESGKEAIEREIKEELDLDIIVSKTVGSFENIFTFDGQPGHEIVLLFAAQFKDPTAYTRDELEIRESGQTVGKAVWRSLDEIRREGSKLYPNGVDQILMKLANEL